jgi:aspartyl-tRNA(Asn)/glutamyl-tRNA(Gln) amidotransferase subunit C
MIDPSHTNSSHTNPDPINPNQISHAQMEHLKNLARLELSAAETSALEGDLNTMVGYFQQLSELDTTGVAELPRPIELVNIFRTDEVGPMFSSQQAMDLAVESEDGFYKVPRVIE